MTALASWIVVAGIVFAAVCFAAGVAYFIGAESWDHRPDGRRR